MNVYENSELKDMLAMLLPPYLGVVLGLYILLNIQGETNISFCFVMFAGFLSTIIGPGILIYIGAIFISMRIFKKYESKNNSIISYFLLPLTSFAIAGDSQL